jgi:hypothetical protein
MPFKPLGYMSSAIDLYTTLEWGYYLDVPATRGRARALLVQRHAQRDRRLRLRSNRRCTSALDGQQELHMASKSCTWPARAAHGQQELHMASKSCTWPARAAHCQQELHIASKSCTWPARAAHGQQELHMAACRVAGSCRFEFEPPRASKVQHTCSEVFIYAARSSAISPEVISTVPVNGCSHLSCDRTT